MSDPNERDAKLVQYMNEAYGNERELELALVADIELTVKPAYRKRLKQHLKETKAHAKGLERRIKKLGGGPSAVQSAVGRAAAAAKAPLRALRGHGEQERMLKNAKSQYAAEHEEISTYLALEAFATKVGDRETAKLARDIRRDEERMARFLEGQIKQLSNAVALAEVPARLRSGKAPKRARAKAAAKPAARKPAAKKAGAKKAGARKASGKKAGGKKVAKPAARKAARKTSGKKAAGKKTAAGKATRKAAGKTARK